MKSVVDIYDQGLVQGYCELSPANIEISKNFLDSAEFTYANRKKIELQMNLYCSVLKKEVELRNSKN